MEQNKIIHIYFATGVEWAADEKSLIFSEVECMGLGPIETKKCYFDSILYTSLHE